MGILGNVKLAQWDGEDGRRWVPASARTREGEKMGPRIREDTGRGEDGSPHSRGHGKGRRWVPASARTREGERVILHFALTRLGLGHSI